MNKHLFLPMIAGIALSLPACKKNEYNKDLDNLKMNEIQAMGSHNSYRLRTDQDILNLLITGASLLPDNLDPNEMDYTHIPMPEQFNMYGVRSVELDIYHDPMGGRFYNRQCNAFVNRPTASGEPKLQEPGFKIIHIPDVDYNTHYLKLVDALLQIKIWSAEHPRHIPLIVMLELKTDTPGDQLSMLGFVTALPMTKPALDSLDNEIKSVFGSDLEGVLTPDEVRKDHATLEEAVLANDWPTLKESRGKVAFVLMADDTQTAAYLDGHTGLEGRSCFLFSEPGRAEAAFIKRDNPTGSFNEIQSLVQQGYIVRTRADAGTIEARNNDYTMQNDAFNSGAQMVSTDYYKPDYRYDTSAVWSDYKCRVPVADVARPNPVNGVGKIETDWKEWVSFED